jgi:hypothetical protein
MAMMQEGMDDAAEKAEAELKDIKEVESKKGAEVTVSILMDWWRLHKSTAGHKRLFDVVNALFPARR